MPKPAHVPHRVERLKPRDLFGRLMFSEQAVLVHVAQSAGTFNDALRAQLSATTPGRFALVEVVAKDIDTSDKLTAEFIRGKRKQLGWPDGDQVPLGYYLLWDSRVAYESGCIDEVDVGLGIGVVGGLVAALLGRTKAGWKAVEAGLEQGPARRMAAYFSAAMSAFESEKSAQALLEEQRRAAAGEARARLEAEQKAVEANRRETARAFRLLGVEESASPADVKSAYRKLARELHPDHADAGDIDEQVRRTRLFQELEAANRFILETKGWK